jgi:adenosylcobinamide-GDP ribazoletransferase
VPGLLHTAARVVPAPRWGQPGRRRDGVSPSRRRIGLEVRGAVGLLTALRAAARDVPPAALAGGVAVFPIVGLLCGGLAAGAAALLAAAGVPMAAAGGVLVLEAITGAWPRRALAAAAALLGRGDAAAILARLRGRPGPVGWAFAAGVLAVKLGAVLALPRSAWTTAFLLAPMLGAWGVAVQCHGGTPVRARGPAAALVGRARFEEFGWASVAAFGVAFALAELAGLVVVVVAAATTLVLRLYAHRRLGGLTGRLLGATRELVETAVLVTLAALAYSNR